MSLTTLLPLLLSTLTLITAQTTHTILVGSSGLSYSPASTTASIGDLITFHFYPGFHTATQGTFDSPCQPMDGGFYSGFFPGSSTMSDESQDFTITVNSTEPMWFYCSQSAHCQEGMVGVINPGTGSDTLAAYAKAAGNAKSGPVPSTVQGGVVGALAAVSSVASSSPSSSASSTSPSSSASASSAASSMSSASAAGSSTHASSMSSASTAASSTHVSSMSSSAAAATATSGMTSIASAAASSSVASKATASSMASASTSASAAAASTSSSTHASGAASLRMSSGAVVLAAIFAARLLL